MAREAGFTREQVRFLGTMPQHAVADHMRKSDAMLIFSDTETFSCVTAEALSCGMPVVSSNAGALPELIHKDNGLLVNVGDYEGLAKALQVMSNTCQTYDRGSISRRPREEFSFDAVGRKLDRIYREVLNS
jgi:glycosyltransferase involved in cell wall biosynthesis